MHRTAVWTLVGLLVLAATAAAQRRPIDLPWMGPKKGPPPDFPEVFLSPAEAAGRGLVPVDARSAEAFEAGHLPGATRVEVGTPCLLAGGECLVQHLGAAGLSGAEGALVYGDDPEAVGRLFWLLERGGVSSVRVLDGGLPAWNQEGLPTEPGPAAREPTTFRPGRATRDGAPVRDPTTAVDRVQVAEGFGTPEMELVDVRGTDAWAGPEGHIPHSLPYDFLSLFEEPPRWPDPVTMRGVFSRLGPRPTTYVDMSSTFVLYGNGPDDPRPGLGYLLLRAMDVRVAVYPGGWPDWRRTAPGAEPLPVVRIVDALDLAGTIEASNPDLSADRATPGLVLFDVRAAPDHRVGHLPGAVSLPAQFCSERVSKEVPAPSNGDRFSVPVAFYCYGRSCVRSRNCSTEAARAGFRNVLWFRGGVPEWQAAGLPLLRSERAGPARP